MHVVSAMRNAVEQGKWIASRLIPRNYEIAAAYPGDKNIASDPAVILMDDFESYTTPDQMVAKWGGGGPVARMRIASEPDHVYAGSKSMELALPISATEVSVAMKKTLNPEQDTVFMRMYQKFESTYYVKASNHNGINLSAKYPGTPTKPATDGTGFFLFLLQNSFSAQTGEVPPGYTEVYSYWPKQRSGFGDHFYPDGTVIPWLPTIGTDRASIDLHATSTTQPLRKWHDNVVIATKYRPDG